MRERWSEAVTTNLPAQDLQGHAGALTVTQRVAMRVPEASGKRVLWGCALGDGRVPDVLGKRVAVMPGPYDFEVLNVNLWKRRGAQPAPPLHTPSPPINNPKCHFKGHQEHGMGG